MNFILILMPAHLMKTTNARNTSQSQTMASPKIGGGHTVWCNPPYSNVKAWMRKCYHEGHKPNTTVVVLVPSRTDTKWWWNYVQYRAEVRFIKGRIKFGGKANKANAAPFPSALVIYRGPEEKCNVDPRQITWGQYAME